MKNSINIKTQLKLVDVLKDSINEIIDDIERKYVGKKVQVEDEEPIGKIVEIEFDGDDFWFYVDFPEEEYSTGGYNLDDLIFIEDIE